MCKWEMEEIETCPDCYGNAYADDNWFTLACPNPHMLIWARLKGFPFWPAKAMKTRDGNVDCRFFGRHDRAWVPIKECYLYSKEPPCQPKSRSKSLDSCIEELEQHVFNLEQRFGGYVYAKSRTQFDPRKMHYHFKMCIPGLEQAQRAEQESAKRKRMSCSGEGDGDVSMTAENNDPEPVTEAPPDAKKARTTAPAGGAQQKPGGSGDVPASAESEPAGNDTTPALPPTPAAVSAATSSDTAVNTDTAPSVAASQPPETGESTDCPPNKTADSVSGPVAEAGNEEPTPPIVNTASAADPSKTTAPEQPPVSSTATPPTPVVKSEYSAASVPSPVPVAPVPAAKPRGSAVSAASVRRSPAAVISPSVAVAAALAPATPSPSLNRSATLSPRATPVTARLSAVSPSVRLPAATHIPRSNGVVRTTGTKRAAVPTQRVRGVTAPALGADSQFAIVSPVTLGPMMVVPGATHSPSIAQVSRMAGLASRPPLLAPSGSDSSQLGVGSVSAELNKQAKNLTDMMRTGLEKVLNDLAMAGSPQATIANLKLQLERMQWKHQMELTEQKKVADSMLAELRSSMDMEQKRTLQKLTTSFAVERRELERKAELRVAETKKKQWCANCGKEAIFYCCWNTSYCDFPCQEAQWPKHMMVCANQQGQSQLAIDGTGSDSSR